jgi:hypothetical protein
MDTRVMIVLGVASLVVIGLTIWLSKLQQRTDALREHHNPAYNRARQEQADPQRDEWALQERKLHVERLRIRALSPDERDELTERWRSAQAQFADDPAGATQAADALVAAIMQRRGYPIGDFEQRVADVSVDRPRVVEHVRAAHAIARRNARHDDHGDASSEDRRQAFVDYRALFDDLLIDDSREIETPSPTKTRR